MQIIPSRFRIIRFPLMHTDALQKFLNHTLHIEEIAVPVHAERKLHSLLRKLGQRQRLGKIDIPQLIEPHIFVSSVIVRRKTD